MLIKPFFKQMIFFFFSFSKCSSPLRTLISLEILPGPVRILVKLSLIQALYVQSLFQCSKALFYTYMHILYI